MDDIPAWSMATARFVHAVIAVLIFVSAWLFLDVVTYEMMRAGLVLFGLYHPSGLGPCPLEPPPCP